MTGFGWAWVSLCIALAIHVADEALTDFLSVYNPTVRAVQARRRLMPGTYSAPLILAAAICLLASVP